MSYKLSWFVLVLCLASTSIVHADDDDLRNLFEAQFYNLTQDIKIGAKTLKINPDEIETIGTEGQNKWYSEYPSFDEDEVQSDWHKLKNGYELVVSDPNNKNKGTFDHVAKTVKLKFDFDFYGQTLNEITIASNGALLTGSKSAEIDLPNHIAPFLSNLPPSEDDRIIYTNDDDKLVVQWTKYVDGKDEDKLEFQVHLFSNGDIWFIYHNIKSEAKKAARDTGYPVIIGLSNSFIVKDEKSSKETVHTYPPTHFPLKKLFIGPYFSLKYTPTPNRCHRREKQFCKNQCIFCEDTNMCVERIETFRTPNPCDKEPEDCIDQCTHEEDLVCGDDGVTYHNECLLKHGACINGVKIKIDRKGPCPLMDNNEEEKNKQADAFDTEGDDDDDDYSNEDEEILRDGEDCEEKCKDEEMKPYCYNAKRLFPNKCLLDCTVKNDRTPIVSIIQGQCSGHQENQDEDDKCQQICTYSDDDVPVCGDDGVMYPNECAFDLAVCAQSDLKVLDDGRCEEMKSGNESDDDDNKYVDDSDDDNEGKTNKCEGMVCNKLYKPVCGTDGNTYSNKCVMDRTACEEEKWIAVMNWEDCDTEKLMHSADELASFAMRKAEILANKYGKLNYHIGVSRTFRLAITLGVGLAVVSTIALIVVLIRHQKTIRKATREMQFQRLAAMNSSQYADEPKGVEMDFVKGVKYDKLPIVP